MKNINIEGNDSSPKVVMDSERGIIELEGNSYPENTFEFYEPLITWIKEYFELHEKTTTTITFKLKYFNSATSQVLFDVLDHVQEGKSNNVLVNWHYDKDNENGIDDYEDFSEEFGELNIQAVPN